MDRPKRPRDPNQLAKLVVDLATGEADEADIPEPKRADRRAFGRASGKARADALSAEQRREIARKAAQTPWPRPEPE